MSKKLPNVLAIYEVTYLANGFVQKRNLISLDSWENIYKPIKKAISIIEDSNRGHENEQSKLLKQALKIMFGDNKCFVENSPLANSIKSGILTLLPQQGGDHKVKFKKIE